MKLTNLQTITKPKTGDATNNQQFQTKVSSLCFSPDNRRLAVATADRAISIYDDTTGERVDKFNTKANGDGDGAKDYLVRSICFNQDISQLKLAVAQSDSIVFVYKWTAPSPATTTPKEKEGSVSSSIWDGKKSICNKFPESSPVSSLIWPTRHSHVQRNTTNQIVYGLQEGKVKIGILKTNKSQTLYRGESPVVSLASHPGGDGFLSGHGDGTIYRFMFPTKTKGPSCIKVVNYPCVPSALSWGRSICVGGSDQSLVFYDADGNVERTFNYDDTTQEREQRRVAQDNSRPFCRAFTTASFNPSGDSIAVGNYDSFYLFSWNKDRSEWEESYIHSVQNMYSVSALNWKPNASLLALGTTCGLVNVYDAVYRQYVYKEKFDVNFVSPSQVLVRDRDDIHSCPVLLLSSNGDEITKINFYHDSESNEYRYIVARTEETLLIRDMDSPHESTSEILWRSENDSKEKFFFDAPNVCVISKAGELSIVELGCTKILGSVRTEYTTTHLLSVRINEESRAIKSSIDGNDDGIDVKMIAYLLDQHTICIRDLLTMRSSTVNHDVAIDFLELNSRGNVILFRDKKRVLHLFNAISQRKIIIMPICGYVQWVPGSDVVVAQSGKRMCVWYNIHSPDQITIREISGEIVGIERTHGKTEVIVDNNGDGSASYSLSDELIMFVSALELKELFRCVHILELIEPNAQSDAMWQQLLDVCMTEWNLVVAERCAAALGDISRVRYLRKLVKLSQKSHEAGIDIKDDWEVKAKMFLLKKDLAKAESIYLSHNKVDEAIAMYENLLMFSEAIRVAEMTKHPEVEKKREKFFQFLLKHKQEETAAHLKEMDGNYIQAINLYVNAGFPERAARVISDHDIVQPTKLLETVAEALTEVKLYYLSGKIYERIKLHQNAMSSYIQGHAYREAISIARSHIPSKVIVVEERWGEYLVSERQDNVAIEHFVEAHKLDKAIESAIKSKMWSKAAEIAHTIDGRSALTCLIDLAKHYVSIEDYQNAEQFFVKIGDYRAVVSMYLQIRMWVKAEEAARSLMSESEMKVFLCEEAEKMKVEGTLQGAEMMYIAGGSPEKAIDMYKQCGNFEKAFLLASSHREDLIKETGQFVAEKLKAERKFVEAEKYYKAGDDWLGAVNMYREQDMWEDAFRVAKVIGGIDALKRVAFAYSLHDSDIGVYKVSVLGRLGLLEGAIEFAVGSCKFEQAIELAKEGVPDSLRRDTHLKYAISLEDEERFTEAEEHFISAGKPKEAIEMYVHNQQWDAATKIATTIHDHLSITEVKLAQGDFLAKKKDYILAENLFVHGGKPDLAIAMYKDESMWNDVLRLTKQYLPFEYEELKDTLQGSKPEQGRVKTKVAYINKGRALEEAGSFDEAIDAYMIPSHVSLQNANDLDEIWNNAMRLVRSQCPSRIESVSTDIASRLFHLGLHKKAAEIYYQIHRVDEAVEVLIAAKLWVEGRVYAQGRVDLIEHVNLAHRNYMINGEYVSELLATGYTKEALDILLKKGDWGGIWKTLKCLPPELLKDESNNFAEYTVIRLKELLHKNTNISDLVEAVTIVSDYLAPLPDCRLHFNIYRKMVCGILSFTSSEEIEVDYSNILSNLKSVLNKAMQNFLAEQSNDDADTHRCFLHLLMTVHYAYIMNICAKNKLEDITCRCSITLLRYSAFVMGDELVTIIPADKAFFLAGTWCKRAGQEHLAFVLFNRYVDLVEAMEESDSSHLSNDFIGTAIPFDSKILSTHFISGDDEREEVRDWVLGVCIDSKVERKIPMPSDLVTGNIYDGLYKHNRPQCIVTGYPIESCNLMKQDCFEANKHDWELFVKIIGQCPWTNQECKLK